MTYSQTKMAKKGSITTLLVLNVVDRTVGQTPLKMLANPMRIRGRFCIATNTATDPTVFGTPGTSPCQSILIVQILFGNIMITKILIPNQSGMFRQCSLVTLRQHLNNVEYPLGDRFC